MQNNIYVVDLNPTKGAEMKKIRPCVVISPDEMNNNLKTVIIAPLTSTINGIPFRPETKFNGKKVAIALDQKRAVDKSRLHKKVGKLSEKEIYTLRAVLLQMYQ